MAASGDGRKAVRFESGIPSIFSFSCCALLIEAVWQLRGWQPGARPGTAHKVFSGI